jgi:hypothetical protein
LTVSTVIIFPSAGDSIPFVFGIIRSGSLKKCIINKKVINSKIDKIDIPKKAVPSQQIKKETNIGWYPWGETVHL